MGDPISDGRHLQRLVMAVLAATALFSVRMSLFAQDSTKPAISLGGAAVLTADIYDFTTTPTAIEPARRPPSLARLVLTPTITIGDAITLPFSIILTSRETNVTTPVTNNPTFAQFVQNPANALGFLSFSPKIEWAQAYIGSHTPQYSELSVGDEQIFGFGVDLRPGEFRVAASTGISQRAIEPDSTAGIRGAYARRLTMAKIGYGTEESTNFSINAVMAKDDTTSISRAPEGVEPQSGVLASANFRIGITEKIYLTGEAGASVFTRDQRAGKVEGDIPVPESVVEMKTSTRVDMAGAMALVMNADWWGIRVGWKYIGPGYVPIGYPFMQSDRLEIQVSPNVRLLGNDLSLSGSFGTRTNNLTGTKGATATQLTASLNMLATLSEALSVTARFANFGVRNNVTNDTFKVENVSRSFELSPTYTIPGETVEHSVTLSYALDVFTDYNPLTGREGSNNTQNLMALWTASFLELPVTGNLTLGYLRNDLPGVKLDVTSGTLGLGYRLFDGRLLPSVGVTHTRSRFNNGADEDIGTFLRFGLQWNATDRITVSAAASTNAYRYDATRMGGSFRENLLETSVTTQF